MFYRNPDIYNLVHGKYFPYQNVIIDSIMHEILSMILTFYAVK